MRVNVNMFSRNYEAALRAHLAGRPLVQSPRAASLGRRAVSLRLGALDLAAIHERSVLTVVLPLGPATQRNRLIKRAELFFLEVVAPIEGMHLAAQTDRREMAKLNKKLHERIQQLAASRSELKNRRTERRGAEKRFKTRKKHSVGLLKESRGLQRRLRLLAQGALSAQESERQKISSELRHDIAEALLAINVRLIDLRQRNATETRKLLLEVSSTKRVVEQSIKTLREFIREMEKGHEN
jgi:hypothetical protein